MQALRLVKILEILGVTRVNLEIGDSGDRGVRIMLNIFAWWKLSFTRFTPAKMLDIILTPLSPSHTCPFKMSPNAT